MRLSTYVAALILFAFAASSALAAHTRASLALASEEARPGTTVLAGVKLQMDPHWHTYWKNAGASGIPTKVEWKLPKGVTAGEIQWPVPEKLPDPDLTTYIYKDTVVLLVPLTLSADLPPGPLALKVDVSWLECEVQCLPGSGVVEASLRVGPESKLSPDASLLANWEKKLPLQSTPAGARAYWEKAADGDSRPLVLEWKTDAGLTNADFFPYANDDFEVQGPTEKLQSDPGLARLRKQVKKTAGDWPKEVLGLLVQEASGQRSAYQVKLSVGQTASFAAATKDTPGAGGPSVKGPSLWNMLFYAFIGGLILNIMPCVLPVLALKVLGFVSQAREDPRRARKLGLIYGLGVVSSFLGLALIVIGLQSAGHRAGWGFQFGNPYFLVVMTTLVTLIALNLFGVFEVHLGGRAMDAAATLSSKHGATGAFFNGLLATLLATSCTAPFLGAAVGFAFAQPPPIVLMVLGTVGLGLAAPYVVLSWQPGWLKLLPKPGAWMERFKVLMGFPMLAAAVWLFSIAALHYGDRAFWLAIFLVFVGLAAWVYGEFAQRNRTHVGIAIAAAVAILAGGYAFALEDHLRWRQPVGQGTSTVENEPGGIQWQRWTPAAVAEARSQGRPVLVDFTAKWCLTCNTIVKPALESASVKQKLRELNGAAFLGDYTGFAPEITDELKRYNRAGVPLVLVFPKKQGAPAIVLPEALTPGMVVNALERAVTL
ncbi:MAG TPA: protein-disulfide reductase DsbD domain-containing protein [Verrucomicrobiae bacterium]